MALIRAISLAVTITAVCITTNVLGNTEGKYILIPLPELKILTPLVEHFLVKKNFIGSTQGFRLELGFVKEEPIAMTDGVKARSMVLVYGSYNVPNVEHGGNDSRKDGYRDQIWINCVVNVTIEDGGKVTMPSEPAILCPNDTSMIPGIVKNLTGLNITKMNGQLRSAITV